MTDIYVPITTFKRLIRKGHQNAPIFESKETVLTTVGAVTVLAAKPSGDKIFSKGNGFDVTSFPFKRRGYMVIAINEEKMMDDEETIEMMMEEFEGFSREALERLQIAIEKLREKEA